MNFLRQLWKACVAFWGASARPPGDLPGEEPLTRFLTHSRWLRADGSVRAIAFIPHKHQVSVFLTQGLDDPCVWSIGEESVARPSGKTIHGRADITVAAAQRHELSVDVDNNPPRHANLVGWPKDDKARWKSIAQDLAAEASSLRRP